MFAKPKHEKAPVDEVVCYNSKCFHFLHSANIYCKTIVQWNKRSKRLNFGPVGWPEHNPAAIILELPVVWRDNFYFYLFIFFFTTDDEGGKYGNTNSYSLHAMAQKISTYKHSKFTPQCAMCKSIL